MKESSADIIGICNTSILLVEKILDFIENCGLQDEQFVLDWLDRLNELSVKH